MTGLLEESLDYVRGALLAGSGGGAAGHPLTSEGGQGRAQVVHLCEGDEVGGYLVQVDI